MTDERPNDERPQTSTRDHARVRDDLTRWLRRHLVDPAITDFVVPETNGMSSETILFDVVHAGAEGAEHLVLRLPPEPTAEPVFPNYDMPRQYRAMALVGRRTDVPVPPTVWLEPDADALGAPFFVMRRVDGVVPPDILPYTFGDNWLFDASPDDRSRLQESSVAVLAGIHSVAADDPDSGFLGLEASGGSALRRHVAGQRAFYAWVSADGVRSPLIERGFEWLDEHWPADEGEAVLAWGDARIGNILYRDFHPVAVLDWEMVAVGPREIDLGWMVYLHRFFQDLAEQYGLPGLPDFMRADDVASAYEALTGHSPRDLRWYLVYAAVRHAAIMFRITRRQIHFGEATMPENPDHGFLHHQTVVDMLDGSYWSKL